MSTHTRARPPLDARILRGVACAAVALVGAIALASGCNRGAPRVFPERARAELWLAGDVHIGRGVDRVFTAAPAVLAGATGVVNLEGPAVQHAAVIDEAHLYNNAAALGALRDAGVGLVGVVNNHARDAGPRGVGDTVDAVRRAGMTPVGGPAGVATLRAGGLRVAVAAFDLSEGAPADLVSALRRARAGADALVVTFHVSAPRLYLPDRALRHAVDLALEAGARVVAAHGTHVAGPVERRGDAVVAWAMGNLLFSCPCSRETEGVILRVSLERERTRAAVVPLEAGLDGAPAVLDGEGGSSLELLEALGSPRFGRDGGAGWF